LSFIEPQQSICGNGVVEPGEQCDCGWEEDCKDDCCYPMSRHPSYDEKPCTLTKRLVEVNIMKINFIYFNVAFVCYVVVMMRALFILPLLKASKTCYGYDDYDDVLRACAMLCFEAKSHTKARVDIEAASAVVG
jgi:hypothetical protein